MTDGNSLPHVDMRAWPATSSGEVDLTLLSHSVAVTTRRGVRTTLGPVDLRSRFAAFNPVPASLSLHDGASGIEQTGPWRLWFFGTRGRTEPRVAGYAHIEAAIALEQGTVRVAGAVAVELDRGSRMLRVVHSPPAAATAPEPLVVSGAEGRRGVAVGDPLFVEASFTISSDDPDLDLALRDVC